MVYGVVHGRVRLGDGAECVWDGSVCGWRDDEHQAIHQREQLFDEDG